MARYKPQLRNPYVAEYRIIDPERGFLHMNGVGFTREVFWAWFGSRQQATAMIARLRHPTRLEIIPRNASVLFPAASVTIGQDDKGGTHGSC